MTWISPSNTEQTIQQMVPTLKCHCLLYVNFFQGTSAAAEKPITVTTKVVEEAKPFAGRTMKTTTTTRKDTKTDVSPEVIRTHQTQVHQLPEPSPAQNPPPMKRIAEVRIPPTFTKFISHCRVPEGQTARFDVSVVGTPKPEIWWFRDGEELRDSPNTKIIVRDDGTSTLVFQRVRPQDHGKITCKAENPAGLASCTAKLIVEGKVQSLSYFYSSIP